MLDLDLTPSLEPRHLDAARGGWGWGMRREMMDYNHWASLGVLGEILPWPGNRVTLAEERDQFGIRVPHIRFALHENDKKLIAFGKNKTEEVMPRGRCDRDRAGSALRPSRRRRADGERSREKCGR